jgi:acyl-CoA reductase-like NAD-dependent aldehyde dehydrogenase
VEEAIAEAFSDYGKTKRRPSAEHSKLLEKLMRVFDAIRKVFTGLTHEDVFKNVYEGKQRKEPTTLADARSTAETSREQRQTAYDPRLSDDTREELEDLPDMEQRYDAWNAAIEAAAACVGARA